MPRSRFAALSILGLCLLALSTPFASILVPRIMGTLPVICAVLCLAGHVLGHGRLPAIDWRLAAGLGGLLALCGLSALWAASPLLVFERLGKMTYLAACGFILHATARDLADPWKRRLQILFLVVFAVSAVALVEEMSAGYPLYRAVRGMPPENAVAATAFNRAAVALCVLAWPAMLAAQRFVRPAVSLLVPLVLTAIVVWTESQSALVGLVAGTVVLAAAGVAATLTRRVVAIGLVVGMLAAPWIAMELQILKPSALTDWRSAAVGARMEIWDAIAKKALERPLTGWGVEAVRLMPRLYDQAVFYNRKRPTTLHPHNGALQVWVELGIAGVVATIAIVLQFLSRIGRLEGQAHHTALALFVSFATLAVVSHGLWQSWWLGLIGAAVALFAIARPTERPQERPKEREAPERGGGEQGGDGQGVDGRGVAVSSR